MHLQINYGSVYQHLYMPCKWKSVENAINALKLFLFKSCIQIDILFLTSICVIISKTRYTEISFLCWIYHKNSICIFYGMVFKYVHEISLNVLQLKCSGIETKINLAFFIFKMSFYLRLWLRSPTKIWITSLWNVVYNNDKSQRIKIKKSCSCFCNRNVACDTTIQVRWPMIFLKMN